MLRAWCTFRCPVSRLRPKQASYLALMAESHSSIQALRFAATDAPLPSAFDKLVKPGHTFLFTAVEVAANRRAWIDEWLSAMSAK